MQMNDADIERCLELVDSLREDLRLSPKCPAIPKIQQWMLAAMSEGYRRGFWARDESDELNRDQYQEISQ